MATRDQFLNWIEDPVTQILRKKLKEDLDNYHIMFENCAKEDLDRLQANCRAARNLLEIEFEDFTT